MGWTPRLELIEQGSGRRIEFPVERLFNDWYAGRDQAAVWKHVEELAEIGVPAPTRTPTLYALGNYLATTADSIQVQHDKTSGEVEYVLFVGPDESYVTMGSDHTDRELESRSVEWSKQSYPDLFGAKPHHVVLMSGTVPSLGGISYADGYDLELHDPVLGRTIRHSYRVDVLRHKIT